jgi:predicted amidohydrolase YtcJ
LLREMQQFDEAEGLQIRTSLYLIANDNCGRSKGDWWKEYPSTAEPGEMLRIGGVKIFADGGSCKGVALSYEMVPGEGLGDLFFSQEELNELVSEVQLDGRQVAIHAAGDQAIELAQNAIAASLLGRPNAYRHRIEHNAIIRPELLPRYGEIGIVPLIFSRYEVCNRESPLPPEEYLSWEWPWRGMMEANPGLLIAWHGDYRRSGRVQPFADLYGLVTRNDVADDGTICPGYAWLKSNTMSIEDALPMMTINAAYALFRDDEVGSLEAGKYADLLILSDNPLEVGSEQIPEIAVWLTMVGGRTAYCSPGHEAVCPLLQSRSR